MAASGFQLNMDYFGNWNCQCETMGVVVKPASCNFQAKSLTKKGLNLFARSVTYNLLARHLRVL